MIRTLRVAVRRLFRAPLHAASVCAILAIAGAALTATGFIAYGILVAPLPYDDPAKLVFLERQSLQTGANFNFTPADYLDARQDARTLENVAATGAWGPVLTGADAAERLRGLRVSGGLFALLGRRAALGRTIEPSDDSPEAEPVVVVSDRLWRRVFGGDPSMLGRRVRLDGEMFAVIGVMPPGFEFPTFWRTGVDIWAPMRWTPGEAAARNSAWLRVFGRLADGATIEQADAEIRTISESLRAEFPESHADRGVDVIGLRDATTREVRPTLVALAGGAALLWLLAIANLTALAAVRAAGRTTETAIRRALGESRARSFGQECLESGLPAFAGSALGAALGYAAVRLLSATAPPEFGFLLQRGRDLPTAVWIAAATVGPALAATAALASAGALSFVGAPLVDRLRARSGDAQGAASLRGLLTGAEIALAAVLLAAAGLIGRGLANLAAVEPGFRPDGVTAAILPVAGSSFGDRARKADFYRVFLERLKAAPGIESAALVNHVPLVGDRWGFGFEVEGEEPPPPGSRPSVAYRVATPGYFRAIGAKLLVGRDFDRSDGPDAPPVLVVNETFARAHLGGAAAAIGARVRVGGDDQPRREVVGVAADLQQRTWAEVGAEAFIPFEQDEQFRDSPSPPFAMTAVARSSTGAAAREMRRVAADLDPTIPVDSVITLDEAVDRALWRPRLAASVMGVFAGLALLLAAIGVYGTAAQGVARRRTEFGVRMALGATRREIIALAIGRNARLLAVGLAVGVATAWWAANLLDDLLFQVSARDGVVFAATCLILALTGLLASLPPARAAAKTDPAEALRRD